MVRGRLYTEREVRRLNFLRKLKYNDVLIIGKQSYKPQRILVSNVSNGILYGTLLYLKGNRALTSEFKPSLESIALGRKKLSISRLQ